MLRLITSGGAGVDGTAGGGAVVQRNRRARLSTSAGKRNSSRVGGHFFVWLLGYSFSCRVVKQAKELSP